MPYEDVEIVTQPYASRTENVNPFNVFTFIGRVDLTPASDDWIDIERLPARVENVEGDFSAVARDLQIDQNGFAPIQWGSWQTNWTGESFNPETDSSQHLVFMVLVVSWVVLVTVSVVKVFSTCTKDAHIVLLIINLVKVLELVLFPRLNESLLVILSCHKQQFLGLAPETLDSMLIV